jgi:hypothetical protein
MHIFKDNGQGGQDSPASNLFRTSANISNGVTTISRVMYFEADNMNEDAVDIASLPEFPMKYAAHPSHPQFKYYGNATIEPFSVQSKKWRATLEYSTSSNSSSIDVDGGKVNSETPPWKLKPDNINFTYPELTIPFKMAFDKKGNCKIPVVNTAGDALTATRSVYHAKLSFTFATQNWDINDALTYSNSINSDSTTICGIKFQKNTALLLPPEATYVTVYQDGSDKIKWQYWNVSVNIMIDISKNIFVRKLLNIGDRAKFKSLDLSKDDLFTDAHITTTFPPTNIASQICSFRLTKRVDQGSGKTGYEPLGDLVFCSWEQYLAIRRAYINASLSSKLKDRITGIYQLQCEQQSQMPLDKDGFLLTSAIQGHPDYDPMAEYLERNFNQYPSKSWSKLNLPKVGVK